MDYCVFCEIIAGRQPASIVYRDDLCTAFMDIRPVNPGHLLVIPNRHATCLAELPEETGAQLFRVAQRLAAALRQSGVRCEGVNLFLADGEAAGQEVFHVHLHVLPRYRGDGFGLRFPPGYGRQAPRPELDEIAGRVRAALGPHP
jgi:diadenosine tetraphosphate (Ap4A) HIT family hydrolase